jgi:hypothetical protein
MSKLLVGLLAVSAAQAQFTEIAASDDGSQIYVTTKFVIDRMDRGTAQRRVFQIMDGQATLFAQPDPALPAYAGAIGPQVSGDGSVVGYTISGISTESYLRLPVANDLGEGTLQLSRNGKWALLVSKNYPRQPTGATLANLQSGELIGSSEKFVG